MQFRWENQSDHSLRKWYAKFTTVKFCPGVSFTICTNQFHLSKKRPRGNETDGFVEMEHEFPFGILRPEKQENLFRCSARTTKKVMFQPLCIKSGALAHSGAPRVRILGYHCIREILVVTSSHVTLRPSVRPHHRHTLFPCSPVPLSPCFPVPNTTRGFFGGKSHDHSHRVKQQARSKNKITGGAERVAHITPPPPLRSLG